MRIVGKIYHWLADILITSTKDGCFLLYSNVKTNFSSTNSTANMYCEQKVEYIIIIIVRRNDLEGENVQVRTLYKHATRTTKITA